MFKLKKISKYFIFGGIGSYILNNQYIKYNRNLNSSTMPSINENIHNLENNLNLKTRNEHFQEIVNNPNFDVLIIGAGSTGAGTIEELSLKGIKGLIIDNYDFASSASSKSSKLLHGGMRYWKKLCEFDFNLENKKQNFKSISMGIEERNYILNKYPYITDQVGFVIPSKNIFYNFYYFIGTKFYELFSFLSVTKNFQIKVNSSYFLKFNELKDEMPNWNYLYKYGIIYFDGLMNDSRLCILSILNSTVDDKKIKKVGSNVLNYCEFIDFIKDANNKIIGSILYDKINKKKIEIKCKYVVNATGIFSDQIRLKDDENADKRILLAEGSHIVVDRNKLNNYGLLVPDTHDGRVMFLTPWKNSVIVGTTDNKVDYSTRNSIAKKEGVKEIIDETIKYFPNIFFEEKEFNELKDKNQFYELANKSIRSKWSGIRPLSVKNVDNKLESKNVSRNFIIEESKSGLISIMGGKWTTYRKMGEDVSKFILKKELENKNISQEIYEEKIKRKYYSSHFDLRGVIDLEKFSNKQNLYNHKIYKSFFAKKISKLHNIEYNLAYHLIENYGMNSLLIIDEIKNDPTNLLKLSTEYPYIVAEIKYLIKYEFSLNSIDILGNRLRLLLENKEESIKILPKIIEIIGTELNWDNKRKKLELKNNLEIIKKLNY